MSASSKLQVFHAAAKLVDQRAFQSKNLEIWVGDTLGSQVLKVYKKTWTSSPNHPIEARSRLFFSIWIDRTLESEGKLMYNLHAFKLRELPGYRLESRKFAQLFREKMANIQSNWENLRMDFGPLTLMEGWISWNEEEMPNKIAGLANQFLEIEPLVSNLLLKFKKEA